MSKARVNGIELYYSIRGDGQPLLFMHGGFGGPGSSLGLDFLSMPLNQLALPQVKVRTIFYHRRCSGRSEYVVEPFAIGDCAEDARALLDHLGVPQAIVVVDSAAGPIGIAFALSHPERLTGLCLFRTGPSTKAILAGEGISDDSGGLMKEWMERSHKEGDRIAFESAKESLRAPAYWAEPDPDQVPEVRAWMERARTAYFKDLDATSEDDLFRYWAGGLRNWAAYQGADYAERLSELTMPVCIIHGAADDYVPVAIALDTHRRIPQSELHLVDDIDHIGLSGHPTAISALHDWLQRVQGLTS